MRVHRLHIKPGRGQVKPALAFAYCLKQQVLGVGWPVPTLSQAPLTWEAYEKRAVKMYGRASEISRVRYVHDNVEPNDLIWTRDAEGKYFLAKVRAAKGRAKPGHTWEYLDTPESRGVGIVNVVRCRILAIPDVDDVTGKIVACFRPSRVIQPIAHDLTVLYSQLLWNQLAGSEEYSLQRLSRWDIFSLIDDRSTEDVIFVYLQCKGWIIVPNSRRPDTMGYEYVAIGISATVMASFEVSAVCPSILASSCT
jgi:hypothetical protein